MVRFLSENTTRKEVKEDAAFTGKSRYYLQHIVHELGRASKRVSLWINGREEGSETQYREIDRE